MKLTLTKKREKNMRTAIEVDRTKFIGGSEVGTVLGLNPFSSPYKLWAEKSGLIESEDISDKEAVWWGTHAEPLVAERFAMKSEELTGKKLKVRKCNYTFSCKEYPWLRAHIDRQILGDDCKAGLEIKTTSAFSETDYYRGEIPPAHYAQCMFYMALTGWKRWYLVTKQDNNKLWCSVIERNEEEIDALITAVNEFWEHVQTGVPVDIDGSASTANTLNTLFPDAEPEKVVELPASTIQNFENVADIQETMKDLKAELELHKNTFKALLKDAETGTVNGWKVNWKGSPRKMTFKKVKEKGKDND